jgi:SAM-dependent methyltransferase
MTSPVPSSGWQLRSNGPSAYERYLVPAIFEPWGRRLVGHAGVRPGVRVLDVACGTGIVARLAARCAGPAGVIAGVDASPHMIEVARAVAATLRPPIDWREHDAHTLPFADRSFDVVLCQFGLMFFADRHAALTEMARVTRPGGGLAVAVWRPLSHNPGWRLFAEVLERHAGADAAATMRAPFVDWDADGLRGLLAGAGWSDVRISVDVLMTRFPSPKEMVLRQAAASPLAGPIGALDVVAMDRLVTALTEALRPYADDGGVAFPSEAYLLTARGRLSDMRR